MNRHLRRSSDAQVSRNDFVESYREARRVLLVSLVACVFGAVFTVAYFSALVWLVTSGTLENFLRG